MNFEMYLMDIIKDQLDEYLEIVYEYDEDELTSLYYDEDGKPLSNRDFIYKFKDKIMSEEVINAVYAFITQISLLEEKDFTRLVAYLSTHYYIANYNNKKNQPVLKFLVDSDISKIVELFYKNERFGEDLVSSFLKNNIDEEKYNKTKEQINKDNKGNDLNSLYQIAYPPRMFTLNQKLREIINNLYNYYISLGCNDIEALELTWGYFFNDLDPLNELEDIGCYDEDKELYKRYMIGLIIGDLYEDTANGPLVKTDNPSGLIAQALPIYFVNSGIIGLPSDPEVRNRMLKYFIILQDDPEKMKSNREKTHMDNREMQLKKVNPAYLLDELTL